MRAYRLYLFDLDGTLFRGGEAIPGAPEAVAELRARGAQVRFLTNNAGQSRGELAAKLARLGFEPDPAEVYGTADAAGRHAAAAGWRRALVVGEGALGRAVAAAGTVVVNNDADGVPQRPDPRVLGDPASVDGVVVGICRRVDYGWIDGALQALLAGAGFVATNRDPTYPLEGGRFQPGAGAIVAAIEAAAGRPPRVLGKPSPDLVLQVLADAGADPAEAVVVGDRPDTDIAAGLAAGTATFLVLTGAAAALPPGQAGGASVADLLR